MPSSEVTLAMLVFGIVAVAAMSLSFGLMGLRQPSTNLRIYSRDRPVGATLWAYQTWRSFAYPLEQNIHGEKPAVRQLQDMLTNAGFDRNRGFVVFRASQVVGTMLAAFAGVFLSNSIGGGQILGLVVGGSVGYLEVTATGV